MIRVCKLQRMYADTHTNIIQIELLLRMRGALIAFQKHDGHTYIHRATAHDVITHINQCKFSCNSLPHGKQDSRTNVCHTRATVTALLKLLYIWMPLHLVYITAMQVCEKISKIALQSKRFSLNLPCGSECHCSRSVHTTAYPWPTVRDPMPRANALGNKLSRPRLVAEPKQGLN